VNADPAGHGTTSASLEELTVRCAAEDADLAKLDALLIEGESRCEVIAQAAAASFYLIEIFARP